MITSWLIAWAPFADDGTHESRSRKPAPRRTVETLGRGRASGPFRRMTVVMSAAISERKVSPRKDRKTIRRAFKSGLFTPQREPGGPGRPAILATSPTRRSLSEGSHPGTTAGWSLPTPDFGDATIAAQRRFDRFPAWVPSQDVFQVAAGPRLRCRDRASMLKDQ